MATKVHETRSSSSSSSAPQPAREAPPSAAAARASSGPRRSSEASDEPRDQSVAEELGEEHGQLPALENVFGGPTQEDDLAYQVASQRNTVLQPDGSVVPAQGASRDGKLRLTDFNVHHLRGRDGDEDGPGQTDRIVEELRARPSDVYTLQEVPPDQAQELADRLGYNGFFARTTDDQGNLTLVHPEIEVENQRKVLLNTGKTGDTGATAEALEAHEDEEDDVAALVKEPRAGQLLDLRLPGGGKTVVTNTHLSAGTPENGADGKTFGELRESQLTRLQYEIGRFAAPGEQVVQAGDLNTWGGEVESWDARDLLAGYSKERREAEQLDWVLARHGRARLTEYRELFDGEQQVSDHPILQAEVPV